MLVRMSKLEIVGPRELLPDVEAKIHEIGCLHLEDVSHQAETGRYVVRPVSLDAETTKEKQQLEEALVRTRAVLSSLPPVPTNPKLLKEREELIAREWKEDTREFLTEVQASVASVEDTVRSLSAEKRDLVAEQGNLARYQLVMSKVTPLAGRLVALDNYDSMALLVEKKFADLIEVVRLEVDRITDNQSHMVADDVDDDTIAVLLVFSSKYASKIKSFISGESVSEVIVPDDLRSLPYDEALARVRSRRKEIPGRLAEIDRELERVSRSSYFTLETQQEVLRDKVAELDVVREFGATDYTFVIIGWMPSKQVRQCIDRINQEFGEKVLIEELVVSEREAEEAPIEYVHSRMVKPFEPIVQMFGTPRYGTVDPVPLVAVFFPLFFGIILGDMGYAAILLAVAVFLHFRRRDNQVLQSISTILLLCGLSSFLFGFAYGEIFGSFGRELAVELGAREGISILGIWLPWNREHLLKETLLFAIGLGAAHILLGLVLGMVNGWRGRSKKHVIEKGATILALVALAPIIYALLTGIPNNLTNPAWALLVIAIPLLVYSAGIMGPIEVLGSLANMVSYARIMAIGLVSVILAETANKMGGEAENVAIGVLIAVLIHALNLTIHVFTPSLHVLRLNFVEFFGKFYESGGKPYSPFRRGGEIHND